MNPGPPDHFDVRHRFEQFAARFAERVRPRPQSGTRARRPAGSSDGYWQNVQDLFMQDVTEKGLRELVEHEAQDTFRFFTRDVDLQDLQRKPWVKRWPLSAWRVFLATAFRLSPARRILFALAVPLLWLTWLRYLLSRLGDDAAVPAVFGWTLVAATLFCALLLLELRDKLALKSDLEVARQIQFGLLPFEPFERPGVSVRAAMRPANTVGGDYFDVIDLGPGRIAVVIGDVAGKGMPAALLMALLQGSLRTLITAGFRGPELISKLNDHLFANIPSNRLITLFYAELDVDTGALSYVNAGHNPPYRLSDGSAERLTATGMALGIVPSAEFEARETRLDLGDRVFLFTDGVTEAFDLRDAEYGEPRLEAYLAAGRGAGDQELIDGVRADVMAFCGSAPPKDDMTLMVVARRS